VVTVVEDCDFASTGEFASNLYGVFNGFSTRVEQSGALFKLSRSSAVQDFTNLKVRKVRSYGEKRVSELLNLIHDSVHNLFIGVTYGHNTNPTSKVNQLVAVDINQDSSVSSFDVYRQHGANPVANFLLLDFVKFKGLRPWNS
jgi:hypothetical protein